MYDLRFPICASLRGRYKNNTNKKTKQHLEIRNDNICNCITTISKNSLIIERKKNEY